MSVSMKKDKDRMGADRFMVKEGDVVAIFHSIHRVMKAEKILKAAGKEILVIPVPRELTAECGLALRIPRWNLDEVLQLLADQDLVPSETHLRRGEAWQVLNCGP